MSIDKKMTSFQYICYLLKLPIFLSFIVIVLPNLIFLIYTDTPLTYTIFLKFIYIIQLYVRKFRIDFFLYKRKRSLGKRQETGYYNGNSCIHITL